MSKSSSIESSRKMPGDWSAMVVKDWAELLSAHLHRSISSMSDLSTNDFPPSAEIEIKLMDQSVLKFKNAFALIDESSRAIGVFTEHCGHHVFPYHDVVVVEVCRKLLYEQV